MPLIYLRRGTGGAFMTLRNAPMIAIAIVQEKLDRQEPNDKWPCVPKGLRFAFR